MNRGKSHFKIQLGSPEGGMLTEMPLFKAKFPHPSRRKGFSLCPATQPMRTITAQPMESPYNHEFLLYLEWSLIPNCPSQVPSFFYKRTLLLLCCLDLPMVCMP